MLTIILEGIDSVEEWFINTKEFHEASHTKFIKWSFYSIVFTRCDDIYNEQQIRVKDNVHTGEVPVGKLTILSNTRFQWIF